MAAQFRGQIEFVRFLLAEKYTRCVGGFPRDFEGDTRLTVVNRNHVQATVTTSPCTSLIIEDTGISKSVPIKSYVGARRAHATLLCPSPRPVREDDNVSRHAERLPHRLCGVGRVNGVRPDLIHGKASVERGDKVIWRGQ